jgi:hypothetical protein
MAFFFLLVAFASGLAAVIYPATARRRGWRVNPAFRKSGGAVMTVALASIMGATIVTLATLPLWYTGVLLVAGGILSLGAVHLLKSLVQTPSIVVAVAAWICYLIVTSRF